MPDDFRYDVFIGHSPKDKAVVRPLAQRLRADGRKPVKQIVFEGERLDVMSVRRWRERVLSHGGA